MLLDPVLSLRMLFNMDNLHHFENVGCGELNIINKHLHGLEKPVGCSEFSVVTCRLSRGKIPRKDRNFAGTLKSLSDVARCLLSRGRLNRVPLY